MRSQVLILLLFFLLWPGCRDDGHDRFYENAQRFWEKKMFGLAARDFERFSATRENDPRAALSLYKAAATHAFTLSSPERAAELYLRLISRYPDSPWRLKAHEDLAQLYAGRLKDYSRAVHQLEEILEVKEGSGEDLSRTLYEMARCFSQMGDHSQAAAVCERILKEYPEGEKSDTAAYHLGFFYYIEDKFEDAERAFRFFLKNYPQSGWAFEGMVYLAKTKEKQTAALP